MRSALFCAAVFFGLAAIIYSGFTPDPYVVYVRHLPPPHPYPLKGVATFCGLLVVEALALWSILRPNTYSYSWGRAVLAALLAIGLAGYFLAGGMHAPPYQSAHFIWLLSFALVLVILFIWLVVARLVRRHVT